jgi:hypothetical protein
LNILYDDARMRMLNGQLVWPSMSLLMLAYSGDPTISFNPAHLIQSDVGTPVAVSQGVLTPSVAAGGYAKSGYAEFLSIPVGNVTFFVMCEANATPASRRLLVYLSDLNNLPFISNGGDYLVKPDWLFRQGWFRS